MGAHPLLERLSSMCFGNKDKRTEKRGITRRITGRVKNICMPFSGQIHQNQRMGPSHFLPVDIRRTYTAQAWCFLHPATGFTQFVVLCTDQGHGMLVIGAITLTTCVSTNTSGRAHERSHWEDHRFLHPVWWNHGSGLGSVNCPAISAIGPFWLTAYNCYGMRQPPIL